MKNLEIERKFLLKQLPDVEFENSKKIIQCYVWSKKKNGYDRYRESIDVKTMKAKYFHTFKNRLKAGVQEEYEEEITEKKFYKYFNDENHDLYIEKDRHIYTKKGLTWEIDVFQDMSLIIAEIELPEENYDLKIPKKINKEVIMEVTEFPQFYNSNLAFKVKK